jgi:hypothetical protein
MVVGTLLSAGLAVIGCKSSSQKPTSDAGDGPLASCPSNFPDDLISDFSSDNSIAAVDGRQGGWYVYGDDQMTGTFDPPNKPNSAYPIDDQNGNPNCSGPGSLHTHATGWKVFGAALGTDFKPRPSDGDGGYGPKGTYDASKYRGIAFWAKGAAPINHVQVQVLDVNSDATAPPQDLVNPFNGASICSQCNCVYAAGSVQNCSPYLVQFGLMGDAAVDDLFSGYATSQIDTTWKRFQVLFVDMKQDPNNPGYHTAADRLDVTQITSMAIQVNANYDSSGQPYANDFEIWIDDVSFIR